MKLLTYRQSKIFEPRLGVLLGDGETVVDLSAAAKKFDGLAADHFSSLLQFIQAGAAAKEDAERLIEGARTQRPPEILQSLDRMEILAPLMPSTIRDCLSFEKHLINCTRTVAGRRFPPLVWADRLWEKATGRSLLAPPRVWREQPIYYKGNPHSVVGHEADVVWPAYAARLDYELEWGVVIGKQGKNISAADAPAHIAGYTIFNDFSARDVQFKEMAGWLGPAKGKDFDTGNVLGPYLVTPEEIPAPDRLLMTARINGEVWSQGSTGQMHFSFAEIIEYISRSETLYPGDFIGSGTVGSGCGLELNRWLTAGDVVELEVENLGVLRNRVVRE